MDWLLRIVSDHEKFKDYAAGLQSIATILAIFVGAIWTYQRFFQFRTGKSKINLALEVVFVRRHSSQWVIAVDAIIENKSSVRHQFNDFDFRIRYLLPSDPLENKRATERPPKKGIRAFWHKTKKQLKKWWYKLLRKKTPKPGEKSSLSLEFPHMAANGSWLDDAKEERDR